LFLFDLDCASLTAWMFCSSSLDDRFPNKLAKSHLRAYEMLALDPHFTPEYKFKHHELDRVTKQEVLRLIDITEPTVDLQQRLLAAKAATDDRRSVIQLSDLLHRVLMLDPAKRMTVETVFDHPFIALPKPTPTLPQPPQPANGTS
jgi:serine/threonine-protein kinase PRP4